MTEVVPFSTVSHQDDEPSVGHKGARSQRGTSAGTKANEGQHSASAHARATHARSTHSGSTHARSDGQTSAKLHKFIVNRLPKPGEPLHEAAAHHFAVPGKMLRSKMALQAAEMLNVDNAAAMHWAVSIEVLHNASLVHDDICDGDQLRRGRPAVWAKFGRDVALTLGDWLVALSFELAAEAAQRSQTPMLVKMLAHHMKTTTAGEAREFDMVRGGSWQDYLQIAADKTAPLLTAPLEGIALMALHGSAAPQIGAYFRFLGNAYQIANDIMNFGGSDGAATSGSDLARRAPNAVVTVFREQLQTDSAKAFDDWYNSGCVEQLQHWQSLIMTSGALSETAERMDKILIQTKRCATGLPPEIAEVISPVQSLLEQVCHRAVDELDIPEQVNNPN
jgi:geranylgeranyl pyrophosphate synthase